MKAPPIATGIKSCLESKTQIFNILELYKYIAIIIPDNAWLANPLKPVNSKVGQSEWKKYTEKILIKSSI